MIRKRTVGVVLFPGFELLDVFGPFKMYGIANEHFNICMIAQDGGKVASAQGPKMLWQKQARWVENGKFFTSSGVSAGIDMSLALIAKLHGEETVEKVAAVAEYDRHRDAGWDPFAKRHGLV